MKKLSLTFFTFLMVVCFAQTGSASILYEATDNGSGNWTLTFDVLNESSADIGAIDIEFDDGSGNYLSFSNFTGATGPAEWFLDVYEDSFLFSPATFSPSIDTAAPLAPAETAVFSLTFDWTGAGTLAGFYYMLWDENFDLAEDGFTALKPSGPNDPPAIPEPGTMFLFGFGLLGTAAISRRKRG